MGKKVIKKISDKEIRDLVMARLRSFSSDRKISIGSEGDYSKEELVENVQGKTKLGDKIIAIQLNYLESLKNGSFFYD